MTLRAAFRILLRGGGQNSCFRIPGGQALHAVHYNIYKNKMLKGGTKSSRGGGECAPP